MSKPAAARAATQAARAQDPDRDAIDRILSGDVSAYALVVRRHEAPLRRLILGILADSHLVEDVLQEVFLIAYRKLSHFRGDSRLSTWLYRVAIREAGRARRRNQRHARVRSLEDSILPPRADPFSAQARNELRTALERLSTLPVRPRTAFLLHVVEGRSHAEIAEILDTRPGTVGSWIHRARARLRDDTRRAEESVASESERLFSWLETELRGLAGLPGESG